MPTLSEALDLTARLNMWINIEIKDLSRAAPQAYSNQVVEKVVAMVRAKGMDTQVIISSFNHDYLRESKRLAPHLLTGALTPHTFTADPLETVQRLHADAWHPGYRSLTAEAVQRLREAGLGVNPYTVNDPEDMTRLTRWGVTGMVTDCPQNVP